RRAFYLTRNWLAGLDQCFLDNWGLFRDELDWAVAGRVDDRGGIDTEEMEQRRAEAFDLVEVVGDLLAELVGCADDAAAFEAAAGREDELGVIPMVAAGVLIRAALRLAAHFAEGEDNRRIEHAAL